MKRFKPSTQYDMAKGMFVTADPKPRPKRQKTPTNSLTARIVYYVESCGGCAMRINVAGIYRPELGGYIKSGSTIGVPDLICVYNGRFVGIEIKTGVDVQSTSQINIQKEIENAKGIYIVARDFESFLVDFQKVVEKKG